MQRQLSRDSEGATESVHRRSQWMSVVAEKGLLAVERGGDEGILAFFGAIFRAPPGCLELGASFRSPR